MTDEGKQKLATGIKWGGAALVCLLVSPIIFGVIQGAVGLIIAGVIGLAAINVLPWLSMKMTNLKVKAIKHEAKTNPIETLETLLLEKRKAFRQFQQDVTDAVAARNNFAVKCQQFAAQYPARAKEFESKLEQIGRAVEQKKVALGQAELNIQKAENTLKEMRAYYDMAMELQKANKAAKMDTGDMYEEMKAQTAFDSVISSMNSAFADMEVAAALDVSGNDTGALSYNPSESLDMTGIKTVSPQAAPVRRIE